MLAVDTDPDGSVDQENKYAEQNAASDKTKLLGKSGKDKIIVGFGNPIPLGLGALLKSLPI